MAMLQLTQNVGQIQELLEALQGTYTKGTVSVDSASVFSQAETLVDRDGGDDSLTASPRSTSIFHSLAKFRALNSEINDLGSVDHLKNPLTNLTDLKIIETSEQQSRSLATYNGSSVWIEWKPYSAILDFNAQGLPTSSAPANATLNAKRLVALLKTKAKPAEFCVPGCLGYFDDQSLSKHNRFGFLYQVSSDHGGLIPKSLAQVLEESPKSPAPLSKRIALAQQLATCLLYFHAVNWLHKSLRSESILFMSSSQTVDFARPYVSSFEYSRPDMNSETFQGAPETLDFKLYCHPDYLGRPDLFRKTYDMYSLGIVLLEIALWQPAKKTFAGWEKPVKDGAKLNIQQRLLRDKSVGGNPEIFEQVRYNMGDRYHDAVRACIEGLDYFKLPKNADQTDPIIATLLQQAYLRLVVDALHGISV